MSRPYNEWRFGTIDRRCKFYVTYAIESFRGAGDVYASEWDLIRAESRVAVVAFQLMMVRRKLRREGQGRVIWN